MEVFSSQARDTLDSYTRACYTSPMTTIENPMTAPETYEDFYRQYAMHVRYLVVQFGVPKWEAEDVAAEILLKFIERDFLAKFDPNYTTRSSNDGKARFKSFVNAFVKSYCMGYRERVITKAVRYPSYDVPPGEIGHEDYRDWLIGPDQHDEYAAVFAVDELRRLREFLSGIYVHDQGRAKNSIHYRNNTLADVLDAVVKVWSVGVKSTSIGRNSTKDFPISIDALGEELHISRGAASIWMSKLIEHAREFRALEKESEKVC